MANPRSKPPYIAVPAVIAVVGYSAPGMAIQALLADRDGEQRVYVVTEETHLNITGFMTVGHG